MMSYLQGMPLLSYHSSTSLAQFCPTANGTVTLTAAAAAPLSTQPVWRVRQAASCDTELLQR